MATNNPQDDDPFGPPVIPTEVQCLHCGREYQSYLIQWVEEIVDGEARGFWRCPTPGCDGAGFGFDIFPTDPAWVDPTGQLQFVSDDDEEDDEAGFGDDDDFDDEDVGDDQAGEGDAAPPDGPAWAMPAGGKVMDYMAQHPGAVFAPGQPRADDDEDEDEDELPPEADPFELAKRSDKDYIEGIHNYCDRWCERCPFTGRCLVYDASKAAFPDKADRDINNEKFWKRFGLLMAKTIGKLREEAERRGIDLDAADQAEAEREQRQREEEIDAHPLARAAFRYGMDAKAWFESNERLIEEYRQELIRSAELELPGDDPAARALRVGDAFEVVQWHQFQVYVKLKRALDGLDEQELLDDDGVPFPRDRDGSAKVALIGMDRSLTAWGVLYEELPEAADRILEFLVHLQRLRERAEATFPKARAFVRPGFDAPID